MTKLISILLASFILLQSINLDSVDLLKMPELVKHFQEHMQKGDSVADFVAMHYGFLKDVHNNQDKEHQKLPFKNFSFDAHLHIIILSSKENFILKTTILQIKKQLFYYSTSLKQGIFCKIFQPPKLVL